MAKLFSLSGVRVLIAGAASGIAAATASACAALGADPVLADILDAAPLRRRLRAEGRSIVAARCDVTDRTAAEAMFAGRGPIDALVVCSGICPFDDWMDEGWDDVFERTNSVDSARARQNLD